MKKGICTLILFLFACTGAFAESSVWKVEKGTSVMYLGATCHFLREADFPLPPEFDKAYKASEIIVFETDLGKLREPATQLDLLAQSMYTDGSTIDKHLSSDVYEKLSAYCGANGIPLETLKQFKPSMLMTTLEVMELMKQGVSQEGVDMFFYDQAKKDQKTVEGLETVEEQINYLVSMADNNEDDFVTYSINDLKTIKQKFEDIVNAWRTGDSEKLNTLLVAEIKTKQPAFYTKLITDRNHKWMPLIKDYLKTPEKEFILVGAAHLVGPEGIIENLKKKGYTVVKEE